LWARKKKGSGVPGFRHVRQFLLARKKRGFRKRGLQGSKGKTKTDLRKGERREQIRRAFLQKKNFTP